MKRLFSIVAAAAVVAIMCAADSAPEKITIWMMGDSTMADKPIGKMNPERGWGQYFRSLFDDGVQVKNRAQNGRSTKSFITRGLWSEVEAGMKRGDYVFIQFGHNDQKESDPERFAAPWGEYSENLRLFVQTVLDKGAVPVLLTPIARRHFDSDGNLKNVHADYPAAMKSVAQEKGVLLIDMTSLTGQWLTGLGDEASQEYFMNVPAGINPRYPDGLDDNTHLNGKGACVVARLAAQQVSELIPELAVHITMYDFVVAQDGSGDFFTVQEAINAAPDYNKNRPTTIFVKNGTYREKVVVARNKNNLHLIGQDAAKTVITYDDYASKIGSTGFEIGTSGTATVYVHGDDFTADNITFENSAQHPQGVGHVGQAVALAGTGDRMRFRNCRFIGNQDTLYTLGEDSRQYYEDCYIEGTTDFIFGFSTAYFIGCTIHSKRNSFVTAASTPQGREFGYVFVDCSLTAEEGITKAQLGRPWRPYAKTVFIECRIGSHIIPGGWDNWRNPENEKTAYYAEYNSSGQGANPSGRVKWSHQLTEKQVRKYTVANILGGSDNWDPTHDRIGTTKYDTR